MNADDRRTLTNAALAIGLAIAVTVLVAWLRSTAPTLPSDLFRVEPADVEPGETLLCDDLEGSTDADVPVPGRATSGEILACPVAFDGLQVTYTGEVVGDVLRRDGGSWLLVNDDPYALVTGPLSASGEPSGTNSGIAVWVPSPQDQRIDTPGRAGVRGDVIEVTGVVLRADPQDGGGLTLRAGEVEILDEEVAFDVPVHWRQVWVAVALAVVVLVLAVRDRRRAT